MSDRTHVVESVRIEAGEIVIRTLDGLEIHGGELIGAITLRPVAAAEAAMDSPAISVQMHCPGCGLAFLPVPTSAQALPSGERIGPPPCHHSYAADAFDPHGRKCRHCGEVRDG